MNKKTNTELPGYSVEAFAAAANCDFLRLDSDADCDAVVAEALTRTRASGPPLMVDVAIDYSYKTFFTKGAVTTNFWRLPWNVRFTTSPSNLEYNTRCNKGQRGRNPFPLLCRLTAAFIPAHDSLYSTHDREKGTQPLLSQRLQGESSYPSNFYRKIALIRCHRLQAETPIRL